MKGYEAKSMEEWEAADRAPTFIATKRAKDGKLSVWDMVLQICAALVLQQGSAW
jgi:hypothetical protein